MMMTSVAFRVQVQLPQAASRGKRGPGFLALRLAQPCPQITRRTCIVRAEDAGDDRAATSETAGPSRAHGGGQATYRLNFLWMERNVAVAVDQVLPSGGLTPITEYYFWPRVDAWEEMKASLEKKTWIAEADKIILLNRTTEVINFWQDEENHGHTLDEARERFPDCTFSGV